MSPQCINVAILECDRSLDHDRSRYGGYGGLVKSWLDSHDFFRSNTSITIWDVCEEREYPKPGQYDVLFITGSGIHHLFPFITAHELTVRDSDICRERRALGGDTFTVFERCCK